jgi:hypothetical protein
MSTNQTTQHIDTAFALWARRSIVAWELDLSILMDAGLTVMKPPSAPERPNVANQTLRRI